MPTKQTPCHIRIVDGVIEQDSSWTCGNQVKINVDAMRWIPTMNSDTFGSHGQRELKLKEYLQDKKALPMVSESIPRI
jgi:hypothetical protein